MPPAPPLLSDLFADDTRPLRSTSGGLGLRAGTGFGFDRERAGVDASRSIVNVHGSRGARQMRGTSRTRGRRPVGPGRSIATRGRSRPFVQHPTPPNTRAPSTGSSPPTSRRARDARARRRGASSMASLARRRVRGTAEAGCSLVSDAAAAEAARSETVAVSPWLGGVRWLP